MTVPPGSMIGIVGGGQLGRMLSVAAAQLGYKCHIFDPQDHPPAADVAAGATRAAYDDRRRPAPLRRSGRRRHLRVRESARRIARRDRRQAPARHPLPVGRPGPGGREDIHREMRRPRRPVAAGRHTRRRPRRRRPARPSDRPQDPPFRLRRQGPGLDPLRRRHRAAWESIREIPAVAEAGVDFTAEYSVIVARWADGRHTFWDLPENGHRDGILQLSRVPAAPASPSRCRRPAPPRSGSPKRLAMSACSPSNSSPAAPARSSMRSRRASTTAATGRSRARSRRSSNSTSARSATCRPGRPASLPPARRWTTSSATRSTAGPRSSPSRGAHVHLYGKGEARPGRKMGHVTRLVR